MGFSFRGWESRGEGKVNKALDSQMQKESALQYRVIEVFMHTGMGISGQKDAEISQESVLSWLV